MKGILIAAVVGVVAILIVAGLALAGVFTGPVNNPCPQGQCGQTNPPIYFSVTVEGYIVNPTWGILYAPIQSNGPNDQPCGGACGQSNGVILAASGSAPLMLFKAPNLDFLSQQYEIDGSYAITYPSGATFSYTMTPVKGTVQGSAQAAWQEVVYQQGPHGTYHVTLTMTYTNGATVSGQAVATASATI